MRAGKGRAGASIRSPDGAQRNPGAAMQPVDRPRITLRSIRATAT
jgi:hypothetical protein